MAPHVRSRLGALAASVKFVLCFIGAAVRNQPLRLPPAMPGLRTGSIWPNGRFMPMNAGADGSTDPAEDPEEKTEPAREEDPAKEDPAKEDPAKPAKEDPQTKVDPDDDWKTKSRKNETRAKKAEREAREAREALEKREEADQTEAQKAVKAAEKKGREEAETKAEKERKADRLEVATTRIAAKKLKVGEGDDAKEVRFADPDDALMHVERAINRGEIDEADIFDDEGKVNAEALQGELADLLVRKPHLRDSGSEESPRPKGDPETRKGEPAKTDIESMTPDDHAKRKYGDGK